MMENLITYTERMENALVPKKAFHTYNRDILHALEIIVAGFRHAQKEVNLLSCKLDPKLYGTPRLQAATRSFLEKEGTKLLILVETKIDLDHPMLTLCNEFRDKVEINTVPDKWKAIYKFNFMLVDDFGYRFEYDRENYAALASFYEDDQEEMRSDLKNFFQILEKHAEPYPIQVEAKS